MEVTSATFLPLLVSPVEQQVSHAHVLDDFNGDLAIAYCFGPPYGERLVTWADLDRMGMARRVLRRVALENLERALHRVRIDGQPPALMLSFNGLESSLLLVHEFWVSLQRAVPGELVVGVPARDVVIITGSGSPPGMERARRAVDRMFFAGGQHLLSRDLLAWREGEWVPLRPIAQRAPARTADDPGHPAYPSGPWLPPPRSPQPAVSRRQPAPAHYQAPYRPLQPGWSEPAAQVQTPYPMAPRPGSASPYPPLAKRWERRSMRRTN